MNGTNHCPSDLIALTDEEARVLAALAGAPLGLTSVHAVARRSGVSDRAASSAVSSLLERGLVRRTTTTLAEGNSTTKRLLFLDPTHASWPNLARDVQRTFRPQGGTAASCGPVPPELAHVFWNEDLAVLDPDEHGALVAKRVLLSKDPQALAWAVGRLSAAAWTRAAKARGFDPRDAGLARTLASAARVRDT